MAQSVSLVSVPGWTDIAGVVLVPLPSCASLEGDDIGLLEIIHGRSFDPVASLMP